MESSQPPRPKEFVPRQGERRRVNALRGVPLIGGLGLVFHDRRSHQERRQAFRSANPASPCALLQPLPRSQPHAGRSPLAEGGNPGGLASWIKRRLKYPWRSGG